jgi:hypothetical protein
MREEQKHTFTESAGFPHREPKPLRLHPSNLSMQETPFELSNVYFQGPYGKGPDPAPSQVIHLSNLDRFLSLATPLLSGVSLKTPLHKMTLKTVLGMFKLVSNYGLKLHCSNNPAASLGDKSVMCTFVPTLSSLVLVAQGKHGRRYQYHEEAPVYMRKSLDKQLCEVFKAHPELRGALPFSSISPFTSHMSIVDFKGEESEMKASEESWFAINWSLLK